MRFLKADNIFDGEKMLNNGAVIVLDGENNFVKFIDAHHISDQTLEIFKGILCPGFVNAHCHLELSHFLGVIPQHTGLIEFAKALMTKRPALSTEIALEQMRVANDLMFQNGIVAVGDICNDSASFELKQKSKIYYHSFIELIALNPQNAKAVFEKGKTLFNHLIELGLYGSLAPHAPYSVSNELLKLISDFNAEKKLGSTIHNQESKEELKFFMGEQSNFDDLYAFLNLDISWFKAPKQSSLKNYLPFLNDQNWILVHNTFTSNSEIETANHPNIFWCFCPNANLYIENTLPAFDNFKNHLNQICIGTDSLASNHQLDMISEMNLIKKNSSFTDEAILQAATHNGAKALGVENSFGKLIPNKNTGLNLIEIENKEFRFVKKIA